ncbi:hypothetical protein FC46_GL001647 [Lactobacillus kalixensis DSM 16043]|uniref:Uncharacterized protein n=1 Tax=Lactobacillus kalixensis DSM 16043 TaxID=1423763 RepID=A0A0R1U3Q8_9LACO|nr:hypothetical protein FC46_GL001647 [Lactobacillus kalixensis DSM 16043]
MNRDRIISKLNISDYLTQGGLSLHHVFDLFSDVDSNYGNFSKEKFVCWYAEDESIRNCVEKIDYYELSGQDTIAFFDLRRQPIDGVYRSLILDEQKGLILSRQSSKQIQNTVYDKTSIGKKVFQDFIKNNLKYQYRHCLSFGYVAFFFKHGITQGSDCISLHKVKDVEFDMKQNQCHFQTLGMKHNLTITFTDINENLPKRIEESIIHNQVVSNSLSHHLEHISLKCMPAYKSVLDAILFNEEWITKTPGKVHLAEVAHEIVDIMLNALVETIQKEVNWLDHQEHIRRVKRMLKDQ